MDPVTIGLVTAGIGALGTLAAKWLNSEPRKKRLEERRARRAARKAKRRK